MAYVDRGGQAQTTRAAVRVMLGTTGAQAQGYPTRPITMVVPFAAGGPTDVIARIVGDHISRTLGQQIVVENVPGPGVPPASHVAPSFSPMAIPS